MSRSTPHNDFFYQIMSRRHLAQAFFADHMPQALQERIDLNQIQLWESKHISDTGIGLCNDIVYRFPCKADPTAFLYAICEHQSTPQPHMAFRFLKYGVAVMGSHLKQGNKVYPPFINFVLYHGKKPWGKSKKQVHYPKDPVLQQRSIPLPPIELVDLTQEPEPAVCADPTLGFFYCSLHCASKQDVFKAFIKAMENSRTKAHYQAISQELKQVTLAYLGELLSSEQEFRQVVSLLGKDPQETATIMRSVADIFRQKGLEQGILQGINQGMQQGVQQGIDQGISRAAINLLSEGLSPSFVRKVTGLSLDRISKLKQ